MFILLIGFVLATIFLPWQQTSRCEGEVVARLPQLRRQIVQSQAKGIIRSMRPEIREGAIVKEGEIIMEIEPLSKDQLLETLVQVNALEKNIEFANNILENSIMQIKTERENLKQMLASIDAEIEAKRAKWQQTIASIGAQKRVHDQAVRELEVATKLKGDVVSLIDYRAAENKEEEEEQKLIKEHAAAEEAYKDLQSKELARDSKRSEVETKIIELDQKVEKNRGDVSTYSAKLSELRVKLGEFERLKIVSPSTGRIQSIFSQVGTNNVKEGDKLFEVIPDTSDLAVEFNVRGLDLPLISVGDKVRLQFDGWPAIQFVGWPSVAVGTFGGEVIAVNPADDGDGIFKIIVGPDPEDPRQEKWPDSRYLRQGVKANGWVILNTVPLGFEIWRQLNGIPPTKAQPGDDKAKDPKLPKFN
ncbi:MAG: HlyD family efflux transporter periplasmic adaptor subunit [Pirellula sp.]